MRSFDDRAVTPWVPTEQEWRRLCFARRLFVLGYINETSVVDAPGYRLPRPITQGHPAFPITTMPERVEGA